MIRTTPRLSVLWAGCALALLGLAGMPAARAAAPANNRGAATAFVHELAAGQFTRAEARFNAQMRRHATAAKLKNLWQFMQKEFGPYGATEGSNTLTVHGHLMVIVHTRFKRQTVGLAVFFDNAHRIAGLRVVPLKGTSPR